VKAAERRRFGGSPPAIRSLVIRRGFPRRRRHCLWRSASTREHAINRRGLRDSGGGQCPHSFRGRHPTGRSYRGLDWSAFVLLAIMDTGARSPVLNGPFGSPGFAGSGTRVLHFVSSSRRPRNATMSSLPPDWCSSFGVRPFLRPAIFIARVGRDACLDFHVWYRAGACSEDGRADTSLA
jgi:hypothetical protein